jgi:hypothetical protein
MVGMSPKPWQGYPASYCLKCNMLVFYGFYCPTCKTPREKLESK